MTSSSPTTTTKQSASNITASLLNPKTEPKDESSIQVQGARPRSSSSSSDSGCPDVNEAEPDRTESASSSSKKDLNPCSITNKLIAEQVLRAHQSTFEFDRF